MTARINPASVLIGGVLNAPAVWLMRRLIHEARGRRAARAGSRAGKHALHT